MAKIKLRRDTYQNWHDANPILASGEPAYDTTNNKLKIGNGTTNWRALAYVVDGITSTNQLVNGNLVANLDASGSLNTPLLFPVSFTMVLDTDHMLNAVAFSGAGQIEFWNYPVTFALNLDGTIETQIDNSGVWNANPGYHDGYQYEFTEADHGIPGYTFSVSLTNVVHAGPAGYTTNFSVNPPPALPATIKSAKSIKLSAQNENYIFDELGTLTVPNNLQITSGGYIGSDAQSLVIAPDMHNELDIVTNNGSNTNIWAFGVDGNLTFPDGTIQTSAYTGSGIPNELVNGINTVTLESDGNLSFRGGANITSGLGSIGVLSGDNNGITIDNNVLAKVMSTGHVEIKTGQYLDSTWTFGDDGNLTLPGNSFSVNYANGTQVSLGVGSANTGNVTFDNITVQGAGHVLQLSPSPEDTANLKYLQVRAGETDSHIHFDSGNNQQYDLILGDDSKYVQVDHSGNIVIQSNDYNGNIGQWVFGTDGTLTVPAQGIKGPGAYNALTLHNENGCVAIGSSSTSTPGDNYSQIWLSQYGGVRLSTQSSGVGDGKAHTWNFDNNGNLTLPNGSKLIKSSGVDVTKATYDINELVAEWHVMTINGSLSAGNAEYVLVNAPGNTTAFADVGFRSSDDAQAWIDWLNQAFSVQQGTSGDPLWIRPAISHALYNYILAFLTNLKAKYVTLESLKASLDIKANNATWTFGTDSRLTLPNKVVIAPTGGSALASAKAIVTNARDAWVSYAYGALSGYTIEPTIVFAPQGATGFYQAVIDTAAQAQEWITYLENAWAEQVIVLQSSSPIAIFTPTLGLVDKDNAHALLVVLKDALSAYEELATSTDVILGNSIWTFGGDGTLTTAGDIIASSHASPAPALSGFNFFGDGGNLANVKAVSLKDATGNIAITTSGSNIIFSKDTYQIGKLGDAIQLGSGAGANGLQSSGIAIGTLAAQDSQGVEGIAIGHFAGSYTQGNAAISIGTNAGQVQQSDVAIAIGGLAGQQAQGANAVAIGYSAGSSSQSTKAVAIGDSAGRTSQGNDSIAIGTGAGGRGLGANSIAIGTYAGELHSASNSIVLNATGSSLNAINSGFFVAPVINDTGNVTNALYYNTSTNEITYGPASSGSSYADSNVQTLISSGTLTDANLAGNTGIHGKLLVFGNLDMTGTNISNVYSIIGGNASFTRITGEGGNLSNIQVGNISGLGNVALINKDGNASNVLYGNGVFASSSSIKGQLVPDTFVTTTQSGNIQLTSSMYRVVTTVGGGTTTFTYILPDTNTCYVGQSFVLVGASLSYSFYINAYNGTGTGANISKTLTAGTTIIATCVAQRGVTSADIGSNWVFSYQGGMSVQGSGSQVLDTAPQITGPYFAGTVNATSAAMNMSQVGEKFSTWTTAVNNTTTAVPTAVAAGGVFTIPSASSITLGQTVTITGTNTGTGSISGYTSGTTYYVVGSPGGTSITLATARGTSTAVTVTAGTLVGLTMTFGAQVGISMYTQGSIMNVTGTIGSNFDVTVTSSYTASMAYNATIIINQGATPYMIGNVYLGGFGGYSGAAQTISWQGGVTPVGNANKKDVVTLSWLPSSNVAATVLFGQLVSYG